MAEIRESKQTLQYLALLVVVCAVAVGLVTLIDFQIKRDILKQANRAHEDLAKLRALMGITEVSGGTEDPARVPERIDIPTDTHGGIAGLVGRDHVDDAHAGMEEEPDTPIGRASFVAPGESPTNGRARNGRPKVSPRDKPVGS